VPGGPVHLPPLHIKSKARGQGPNSFPRLPSSKMDSSSSPASFPTSPNAIFLPICAALVIAANYVPLLLLVRVKKVAACTLVLVLVVGNAFTFINAILWPNDNTDGWYDGVGLCDVQVVLKIPLATLLATCSAYISMDLAKALDTDNPRLHETARTRRRRLAFELVFCFAVPILQVALHYVVQASRFGVVTVYGCADIADDSWPAIVILSIWPPLFGLVNCYFAGKSKIASSLATR
jgi:pheromone a factor receptor